MKEFFCFVSPFQVSRAIYFFSIAKGTWCSSDDDEKSFGFHIRSFHSSTLPSGVTPPMQNALHSPLTLLNPKSVRRVWATKLVRWAESGGWCYERSFKWPSFGCLNSKQKPFSLVLIGLYWLLDFIVKIMNDLYIYGVWLSWSIHSHRFLLSNACCPISAVDQSAIWWVAWWGTMCYSFNFCCTMIRNVRTLQLNI